MVQVGTWAGELEIGSDGGLPMESSANFKDAQGKRRIWCTKNAEFWGTPIQPQCFSPKSATVLFLRKRIEMYQMGLEMNKNAYLFGKKKVQEFCVYPLPYFCLQKND